MAAMVRCLEGGRELQNAAVSGGVSGPVRLLKCQHMSRYVKICQDTRAKWSNIDVRYSERGSYGL